MSEDTLQRIERMLIEHAAESRAAFQSLNASLALKAQQIEQLQQQVEGILARVDGLERRTPPGNPNGDGASLPPP